MFFDNEPHRNVEEEEETTSSLPKLFPVNERTTVGALPTHAYKVDENALTLTVEKFLRGNVSLPGVIIVNEVGFVGVISRRKFYEILGRRYGVAVFMNRPIGAMLESTELPHTIVPASHTIGDTVTLALGRPADQVYEPILITSDNEQSRLLDIYTLLLAQSMIFASLQEQLQQSNRTLERRVAERTTELQDRLGYEQALAWCANSLLRAGDIEGVIPETLHHLLEAAEVSRVFISENVEVEGVGSAIRLLHQVNAPGTPAIPVEMEIFPYQMFGPWTNRLWLGQWVIGYADQAGPLYRPLFDKLGTTSLLLLPYGEPGAWKGVIGFSEHTAKRAWDEHDIRLLQTVAQMISSYLERKHSAEELAYTRDEALQASQFKSQLLARVSHEFRTPLSAILGYTQLLQMGSYGALNEEQKHTTALVVSSTKYLDNLVNGLLDQAQLDRGKLTLQTTSFDVRKMIREVETRVRVLAEEKKLTFQVDLDPELPDKLSGDMIRIQQVLTNLLGNAIKFTQTGQIITRVFLSLPDEWVIQVADTGPGIPDEDQERIFDAFHQVDGSPTRKHSGTGLGLSISMQLIQMMNGIILLDSKLGQGSTFSVHLPLNPDHYLKEKL